MALRAAHLAFRPLRCVRPPAHIVLRTSNWNPFEETWSSASVDVRYGMEFALQLMLGAEVNFGGHPAVLAVDCKTDLKVRGDPQPFLCLDVGRGSSCVCRCKRSCGARLFVPPILSTKAYHAPPPLAPSDFQGGQEASSRAVRWRSPSLHEHRGQPTVPRRTRPSPEDETPSESRPNGHPTE